MTNDQQCWLPVKLVMNFPNTGIVIHNSLWLHGIIFWHLYVLRYVHFICIHFQHLDWSLARWRRRLSYLVLENPVTSTDFIYLLHSLHKVDSYFTSKIKLNHNMICSSNTHFSLLLTFLSKHEKFLLQHGAATQIHKSYLYANITEIFKIYTTLCFTSKFSWTWIASVYFVELRVIWQR